MVIMVIQDGKRMRVPNLKIGNIDTTRLQTLPSTRLLLSPDREWHECNTEEKCQEDMLRRERQPCDQP